MVEASLRLVRTNADHSNEKSCMSSCAALSQDTMQSLAGEVSQEQQALPLKS